MKKICLVTLALTAVFGMVACKSTNGMEDGSGGRAKTARISKEQAEINKSFDKVYNSHAGVLVLDGAERYTVKDGDTLTGIAKGAYGGENGYYFPIIMLASHDVVKDPERIEPGMQLMIPSFDANIKNKDVAKRLSPYFKDIAEVYEQKKTAAPVDIRPNLLAISDMLVSDEPTAAAAPEAESAATDENAPEATSAPEMPAAEANAE